MTQQTTINKIQSKKIHLFLIILASIIGAVDIFFIITGGLDSLFFLGGGGSILNLIFAIYLLTPLTKNIPNRTSLVIAALIPNILNLAGLLLVDVYGFRYFGDIIGASSILFIFSFYIIIKQLILAFKNKLSWKIKLFLLILLFSTAWALLLSLAILSPCFMGACF